MRGDLTLRADADRLQQALSNLLGNAVQPIPPHALESIFQPLVQAPSGHADRHERSKTSLGLGLFIVREIVLAHEGSITVESSRTSGTVFTIRLPRARD